MMYLSEWYNKAKQAGWAKASKIVSFSIGGLSTAASLCTAKVAPVVSWAMAECGVAGTTLYSVFKNYEVAKEINRKQEEIRQLLSGTLKLPFLPEDGQSVDNTQQIFKLADSNEEPKNELTINSFQMESKATSSSSSSSSLSSDSTIAIGVKSMMTESKTVPLFMSEEETLNKIIPLMNKLGDDKIKQILLRSFEQPFSYANRNAIWQLLLGFATIMSFAGTNVVGKEEPIDTKTILLAATTCFSAATQTILHMAVYAKNLNKIRENINKLYTYLQKASKSFAFKAHQAQKFSSCIAYWGKQANELSNSIVALQQKEIKLEERLKALAIDYNQEADKQQSLLSNIKDMLKEDAMVNVVNIDELSNIALLQLDDPKDKGKVTLYISQFKESLAKQKTCDDEKEDIKNQLTKLKTDIARKKVLYSEAIEHKKQLTDEAYKCRSKKLEVTKNHLSTIQNFYNELELSNKSDEPSKEGLKTQEQHNFVGISSASSSSVSNHNAS